MRNVSLHLRFVGTQYHGWQLQKNAVTVASVLEAALLDLTGAPTRVTGCGRTDAGVHALDYVANFFTECSLPADRFSPALNARLPGDIRVLSAREEDLSFHAIADCVEKEYHYYFHLASQEDPFLRDRVYWTRQRLDRPAMEAAARAMEGTHDFAGFRSLGTPVKSTVRTVFQCVLEDRGPLLRMRVRANGFLYNMARTIAGTVLYAGQGKLGPDTIEKAFSTGDRALAGPTLPACGLYLAKALYERR